jgi:peroxiredoxin
VEVVAFGPDAPAAFRAYFARERLPFRGVPDPGGRLLARLGQEVNWFRLGRMPALLAVRGDGEVVHVHRGRSMRDLPDVDAALAALEAGAPAG